MLVVRMKLEAAVSSELGKAVQAQDMSKSLRHFDFLVKIDADPRQHEAIVQVSRSHSWSDASISLQYAV